MANPSLTYRRILLIDNYDSFTYNLADYFRQLGCEVAVYRNSVPPSDIAAEPDLVVLSPGPGRPEEAGYLMHIIERFYEETPILGICLGHQALVSFFGGSLKYVEPVHGHADRIVHDGKTIFTGLPDVLEVGRYHSLAAGEVPASLEVSARSNDGIVMGIRHKYLPIEGVQFHPESVLSMLQDGGFRLIQNTVSGHLSNGFRPYRSLMRRLQDNAHLTRADFEQFVQSLDAISEDQKLVLLVSLSFRLQNPYYLYEFIQVLLERVPQPVDASLGKTGLDICGTGGSGLPRVNTSTLASLLVSAAGLPILKHGNRASSGRYGSFDLLADLGLPMEVSLSRLEEAFRATGLAFIYAPGAHPTVGKFSSTRARVAVPTIFNILGPLLNPYNPRRQLIGTAFPRFMELIFEAGILMGKTQLYVVRGEDGLDEISVSGSTRVLAYEHGERRDMELRPQDFGIDPVPFEAVAANEPADKLAIARAFLEGRPETEHHKLVLVNAAFVESKFQSGLTLPEAYANMEERLRRGEAMSVLRNYAEAVGAELAAPTPSVQGA